jgi:hypothetical protein
VSSHFAAMGIPLEEDTFERVIDTAVAGAGGQVTPWRAPYATLSWADRSGAGIDLLFRAEDNALSLHCAVPQFAGTASQRVRVTGFVSNDSDADPCPGCTTLRVEVLDEAGEMVYPLVVAAAGTLPRWDALAAAIESGAPQPASLVFVAEEATGWADAASYEADQGEPPYAAAESLIPVGMFGGMSAAARVTGTVLHVRERTTAAFGVPFLDLRLRTFGGEYDVVGAPGTLPAGVAAGQTLRVDAWVCGRVGTP